MLFDLVFMIGKVRCCLYSIVMCRYAGKEVIA